MKKTKQHKYILKDQGLRPFFWTLIQENGTFALFRNWLTGEVRFYQK